MASAPEQPAAGSKRPRTSRAKSAADKPRRKRQTLADRDALEALAQEKVAKGEALSTKSFHAYPKSPADELIELMDKDPQLNNKAIIRKLREGFSAKKKTYFAHEGVVTDTRTDADIVTRRGYVQLGIQIRGMLVNRNELSGPGGTPIAPPPDLSGLKTAELLALLTALQSLKPSTGANP